MNFILKMNLILFLFIAPGAQAQRIPEPQDLISAVDSADIRRIDELLGQGADVNAAGSTGRTVLQTAVESGSIELVGLVLEAGANPDIIGGRGYTPLMLAVNSSRMDLLALLLAAGASPNIVADPVSETSPVSALSLALNRGEFEMAARLITAGANPFLLANPEEHASNPLNLPYTRVPLDSRIFRARADVQDAAQSPDWNRFPLHEAARNGNWRAARGMLDSGEDANTLDGRRVSPLMTASFHGHKSLVSLLLQRGASVNLRDDRGRTALSYAAVSGRIDIVRRLIEAGTPMNPVSNDQMESSPLYLSIAAGHHEVLDILLDSNAPVDIRDGEGTTPLMMASWLVNLYAVRKLLPLSDAGGPAARDDAGRSALAWSAAAFDRDKYIETLLGLPGRSSRNYPVARLLARRRNNPANPMPQPSTDLEEDVVQSWSPGRHTAVADDWRRLLPAPIPVLSKQGDLVLYRILRDEEPGEADQVIFND